MANRALKKTAKVLGGLGAAYVLSDMLGPKVRPEDVNEAEALKDPTTIRMRQDAARFRGEPAPAPAPAPASAAATTVAPPLTSRVVVPSFDAYDESQRKLREAIDQLNQRYPANKEPESLFKKGGAVKGWGKARGARAAKVY